MSFITQVEYVDEDISAEFGNTLGVSKTQSIPKVSYEAADAKKMYTLAMVDPDAPSRQVKNKMTKDPKIGLLNGSRKKDCTFLEGF